MILIFQNQEKCLDLVFTHVTVYTKYQNIITNLNNQPWKKCLSLQLSNCDLWLEILSLLNTSQFPINITLLTLPLPPIKRIPTQSIDPFPPLTVFSIEGGVPLYKLKERIGMDMWIDYCYKRDVKFPKEWKWAEVDWEPIRNVWFPHQSSALTIRFTKLILIYDFTNERLHRFNVIEAPTCHCGHPSETTFHYLLECQQNKSPLNYKETLSLALNKKLLGHKGVIVDKFIEVAEAFSNEKQAKYFQGIIQRDEFDTLLEAIALIIPNNKIQILAETFHTSIIYAGKQYSIQRWKGRRRFLKSISNNLETKIDDLK